MSVTKLSRRNERGLSLLELLITVVIALILMALAVPNFQQLIRQNRLSAQTNEFVSALHLTQSEAVKSGRRVAICASIDADSSDTPSCGATNWDQGWVIFVDTDADATVDVGETIIQRGGSLRLGTTLRGSGGITNAISYSATAETANAGTLVLCDQSINYARAVLLGVNGRIRQAKRDSAGVPLTDDGTALTCSP